MKLMKAQPMLQAAGGSMRPDVWIMVMNFLVHWTLAYAQVRGRLGLVFIILPISTYAQKNPGLSKPGPIIVIIGI